MKVIDFEASLPETVEGPRKLRQTQNLFDAVRAKVRMLDKSSLHGEWIVERISNELGADRYMVEDVISAELGMAHPVLTSFIDEGFWTFGRRSPRFGTPWASLAIDDSKKAVALLVRYGGTFDDIEDPAHWLRTYIRTESDKDYKTFALLLEGLNLFDFWWIARNNHLYGKIVVKPQ